MQRLRKNVFHLLVSHFLRLPALRVSRTSRFEIACCGNVQVQQHSQLEGFRQVACSSSGLDAVSRAEAELHGLPPHLPGQSQFLCPPPPRQPYLVLCRHPSCRTACCGQLCIMNCCLTCLAILNKCCFFITSLYLLCVFVITTALSVTSIPVG